MKSWRSFVGQGARLRRLLVPVLARTAQRVGVRVVAADEPRSGPPAHWVERVQRGAPGLLAPSLRARGEPATPPATERVVLPQTELAPQPDSSPEELERDHLPPAPPGAPQLRTAPL